jgi:hypothetical protein
MRTTMLPSLLCVVLVALAACSEGGGGDRPETPDAASVPPTDAPTPDAHDDDEPDARPDARIELGTDGGVVGGFGQKCSQTVACPVDAPICVLASASATEGLCSIVCADDFRFTTNGSGDITTRPDPATDRLCATAYSGGVGTSACQAFLGNTFRPPVVGRPSGNTEYTGDVACVIRCGVANTCPAGLRCNPQQVCAP